MRGDLENASLNRGSVKALNRGSVKALNRGSVKAWRMRSLIEAL
jgi:hypothetical protein